MKIACDRPTLTRSVGLAASLTPHRSPKPVLGCIKVDATAEGVCLLATDLEVGLRIRLENMEVSEPGVALVPADRLHAILRELEEETVSVTSAEQQTTITAPNATFTILGEDPADFPEVPDFPESGAFEMAADDLLSLTEKTIFATAKENTRYALNGVLWEVCGPDIRLVATDGRRLSLARGKCKGGPEGEEGLSAIVPAKAIQLIERCLADAAGAKEPVRVVLTEREILLESPPVDGTRRIVYSRLVDGHFPKYEDVIPKGGDKRAEVEVAPLLGALRKASILTTEEARGVILRFSGNELLVRSDTPEMGTAEIRMPVQYEGEDLEIGFNPAYLIEAAKVADGETLRMAFTTASKPALLTAGQSYTHVLMPVSIV